MRISSIFVGDFGALVNKKFEGLEDKQLIIVYGPNEAGKSSLFDFVFGVLFGFPPKRPSDNEPYRSSKSGKRGGRITLLDEQEYPWTIKRYGEGTGKAEVFSSDYINGHGGHNITPDELNKKLFKGIDKDSYRAVYVVRHTDLISLNTLRSKNIEERLSSAAVTGSIDAQSVVEQLKREQRNYAPAGPTDKPAMLDDAEQNLKTLKVKLGETEEQLKRYPQIMSNIDYVNNRIAEMRNTVNNLNQQLQKYRELYSTFDRWKEYEECRSKAAELEKKYPGLKKISDISKLVDDFEKASYSIEKLKSDKEELDKCSAEIENIKDELEQAKAGFTYDGSEAELEETAKRISIPGVAHAWIERSKVGDEVKALEKSLNQTRAKLYDLVHKYKPEHGIQGDLVNVAASIESEIDEKLSLCDALWEKLQKISCQRDESYKRFEKAAKRRFLVFGSFRLPSYLKSLLVTVGVLLVLLGALALILRLPGSVLVVIAGLVSFGVGLAVLTTEYDKEIKRELDKLGTIYHSEVSQIASSLGTAGIVTKQQVDVLKESFEKDQFELTRLAQELQDYEHNYSKLSQEWKTFNREWDEWKKVNHLPAELAPQGLFEYIQHMQEIVRQLATLRKLDEKKSKLSASIEKGLQKFKGLLYQVEEAGVLGDDEDSVAYYVEEFTKVSRELVDYKNALDKLQSLKQDFERNFGPNFENSPFISKLKSTTKEELQLDRDEFKQQLDQAQESLDELNKELGRLNEQKKQLESIDMAEMRSQYEAAELEFEKRLYRWRKLVLAELLLSTAIGTFKSQRQPDVIKYANEFFSDFTEGKWTQIVASGGLTAPLKVATEDGLELPVSELSRGTQDQLYLALRFGLIKESISRGIILPVLLDEVLITSDKARQERASAALGRIAKSTQVFYFTCHEQTRDFIANMCMQTGIEYDELDLGAH